MTGPQSLTTAGFESPIGPLAVAVDESGRLRGVSFGAGLERAMAREYPGAPLSPGAAPAATVEALAAGTALNRNPISLVLACHRVVGADGAMVGFGGGLERKTWLLRHEGALLL